MNKIIHPALKSLSNQTEAALKKLLLLTEEIENESLIQTVKDVLKQITAPFTFVIVGEVKSGKSSFINALLNADKEICKVAPSPMTDTIQQIVFGEEEQEVEVNPFLKKIYYPAEILKEISIVDTPGTNTIVDHHQEITERFIPYSDLIVFVFESKNPYRRSAWEFFNFINEEWRRKIIFVLQQKDLMDPSDLSVNIKGVEEEAVKKGIDHPLVFAVSAKQEQEQENKKEESGFIPLRNYITSNITGGKAPFLKIENNINTAQTVNEKIKNSLELRTKQWEYDTEFRENIKNTLSQQQQKTQKHIEVLIENLLASYDRITLTKEKEMAEGLSFIPVIKRSFGSIFGSQQNLKHWLQSQTKDFEYKLNTSLKDKLQNGIIDVADNIQMMAKMVHIKIKDSKTILKDSDEIFANIAERRANVLKDLQAGFADFMNNSENFYDDKMVSESGKMVPNLAAGSGVAVIGIVLTTIANGAVFDITGGVLTTIGLLFAGFSLGLKRKKILGGFREEIKNGRTKIDWEVNEKLKNYTQRIRERIDDNFYELDLLLDQEKQNLEKLNRLKEEIDKELEERQKDLSQYL